MQLKRLPGGLRYAALGFALGAAVVWLPQQWNWPASEVGEELPLVNPFASCPQKLSSAERERRVLREEVAYLKQSVLIEQEACFDVRETLQGHEDELARLNEQLAFYRGIVSPEEDEAGLRVHKLDLFENGRRDWQFRLTLIQAVRQTRDATGLVKISVEGMQDDVFSGLSVTEMDPGKTFSGLYQFRYYAELHGQFRLPSGFKPLRIVVEAIPEKRGLKPVRRTWVWQEITAANAAAESQS